MLRVYLVVVILAEMNIIITATKIIPQAQVVYPLTANSLFFHFPFNLIAS